MSGGGGGYGASGSSHLLTKDGLSVFVFVAWPVPFHLLVRGTL